MATNHQVVEEALDRLAGWRPLAVPAGVTIDDGMTDYELPDFDVDAANPVHDDDDGEGLGDFTAAEADDYAAGPPWLLAVMERCIWCDSRSAYLRRGACPTCTVLSHPAATMAEEEAS